MRQGPPPRPPPRALRRPAAGVQLADLFLMELTNWRWSWRGMVLTGMVAPLFSLLALGVFARDAGSATLAYVLTGNVVLALMFENLGKVSSRFAYMRVSGGLEYYATLPVGRAGLVLATLAAFLLLSLPSLLVTVLAGAFVLGVPLAPHPLILLAVPLCAMPLAGIGALIGAGARTPEEAGSLSLLVTLALVALGPVIVPPERLPAIMLALGRLSPATYAASALRQTLLGPVTGGLALDLAILAGLSVAILALVGRGLRWRQE